MPNAMETEALKLTLTPEARQHFRQMLIDGYNEKEFRQSFINNGGSFNALETALLEWRKIHRPYLLEMESKSPILQIDPSASCEAEKENILPGVGKWYRC